MKILPAYPYEAYYVQRVGPVSLHHAKKVSSIGVQRKKRKLTILIYYADIFKVQGTGSSLNQACPIKSNKEKGLQNVSPETLRAV